MEEKEMLEQSNDAENVETQTTEENVEGIELTDTAEEESQKEQPAEEKEEVRKTLKELLRENPDYQEEYNQMMKTRLDRKDREFEKTLSKYRDTEEVLKSTLNAKDIAEANTKLREFYESEGVKLPEVVKPELSTREVEILAQADANEIINEGYDAMLTEANRLAQKGYVNMTPREKVIFTTLGDKLTEEKERKELLSLGASKDLMESNEWKEHRKKFNSKTPMKDIYALYKGNQPKPKVENPGSMKNTPTKEVKDLYTDEEISKLTLEDLDKPGVFEAVRKSMTSR